MECKEVHKEFNLGKRLLITDIKTLGGKMLEVIDYFNSLPKRWDINYFHKSEELKEALERGDIENKSVAVLPNDEGLVTGHIYSLTVKHGVRLLVLVGTRQDIINDRDLPFYIVK